LQQISIAGTGEESRQEDILRIRELTRGAQSCGDLEAAAQNTARASSRRLDMLELSDMDPVLRARVQGLEVGQLSEPFESENSVAVLMVCDRTGASPPGQLRERVRRSLTNERLEANAQRMLRNLRREAFVDVRL
jgi:peptidyl-prolyl cis-trans isomerase SurA